MNSPASGRPLLDIATLIVRPAIVIDGTRYALLSPDELSVLDSHRFAAWSSALDEAQKGDPEAPAMTELVDAIARKVLVDVPGEVFAKLSGAHKIAVAEVFTGLLLRSRMRVAGATATAMGNPQIGEAFSLASSGFMAAIRAPGWWTRLWRWSGLTSR